ncbi:MAG: putative O-glycosylation ligase, exosortase A system-associated [Alphaproteobacteria bacterium 64-11]|nr:MAG: putative O-glycosylation ligase, exosortase A system-associated [Alphaproteobacteria bacterium 64-11]
MRDLLLLAALAGLVPMVLRAPQIGLLVWTWVTLFNPQREVFGFLRGFELNFYVTVLTVLAWAISRERKTAPLNPVTGMLILFALWVSTTTYNALDYAHSYVIWDRTIKTIILALAILALVNTKARIQALVWVVVVALGYYAVKGGGFVLMTGGRSHVFGPANTMIEDNNQLGLALVMILPLMNYLRVTSRSPAVTKVLLAAMGLTLVAIIGTYSRGALLALAVSAVIYAARSRAGFMPLMMGCLLVLALPSLMPGDWFHRMSTIQTYHQDLSFEGRVEAWRTSFEIARLRFLGGGFSAVDLDWVAEVYNVPGGLTAGRAAHSMYFEVLGDHGFMGLALYLMLIVAALFNTSVVIGSTRDRPGMEWAGQLARTLQISIAGYLVGGAALSMAYYDGFFILLALSGALALAMRSPISQAARQFTPRWSQAALPAPAMRTATADLRAGFRPSMALAGGGAG